MRRQLAILAILFAALYASPSARGDTWDSSGITFFRSDVTVRQDATLEIREEITVNNAASFYKYGFKRNLPITSEDRWDTRYVGAYKKDNGIRVDILEVTRDGSPIKYHQGSGYGYSQILIGERNVPLDSGEHKFVIRYTVHSGLNFGAVRDTLYWSGIGDERKPPVAEAILAVHLPPVVPIENVTIEPRIGFRGPRSPDRTPERMDAAPGTIAYRVTHVDPRQSLSLVLTWPSGLIKKPMFYGFQRDLRLLAAPAILFLYYLIAWFRIGPDPKPGTVVARYEPPQGFSPAAVRYISRGTTDGRTFAAVISQLAIRGCLRVEPVKDKYKLSRLVSDPATEAALASEEKLILALLFDDGPVTELSPSLDQSNTAENGRYIYAIHRELSAQLGGKYFTRHTGIIVLGVLATFAAALSLAATANGRDATGAMFMTVWILFIGLAVGLMIQIGFASSWKTVMRSGSGWLMMLPATAAISIFAVAIGYMLKQLAQGVSLSYSAMVILFLAINIGWGPRFKRKTIPGREISDQIAGFRQFLLKVEEDKLNRASPAGQSEPASDKMLPYAIALEVCVAWGDHLAEIFMACSEMVEG